MGLHEYQEDQADIARTEERIDLRLRHEGPDTTLWERAQETLRQSREDLYEKPGGRRDS